MNDVGRLLFNFNVSVFESRLTLFTYIVLLYIISKVQSRRYFSKSFMFILKNKYQRYILIKKVFL